MVTVSKAVVGYTTGGSNPSASANVLISPLEMSHVYYPYP